MKITDTYGDTLKTIIGRVSASPLLSCCRQKSAIERILAEKDVPDFFSFEFNRAGTSVTLYLYADPDFNGLVFDKETEDDFTRFTFRTEINWPCHGGADPATALARLAFYEQVALLAAEIHAEFGGMSRAVYKLFRTRDQRVAAKAEEQAKKVYKVLDEACLGAKTKGLRVGHSTTLTMNVPEDLPELIANGHHPDAVNGIVYVAWTHNASNGRQFKVTIQDFEGATSSREAVITRMT